MARQRFHHVLLVCAIVMGLAATAFAQTQVRVTRDGAIIWGRDARVPITTVKSGTVLDVEGQQAGWYVVRVPPESGGKGELGLIAKTQVAAVGGGPQPELRRQAAPPRTSPPPIATVPPQSTETPARTEWLGFGQVGYNTFLAQKTFNAVFGNVWAVAFGGGVRLNIERHWFVEGSIDWMAKTGQRVVVVGGQTFALGIQDRIHLVPVSVNAGYRHEGQTVTPYVGAGVGIVHYQETFEFADPSENINDNSMSYAAIAGIEVGPGRGAVRTALEVQFSMVPRALGSSGASAAFNEKDLGGIQVRVKVLAGRKRG